MEMSPNPVGKPCHQNPGSKKLQLASTEEPKPKIPTPKKTFSSSKMRLHAKARVLGVLWGFGLHGLGGGGSGSNFWRTRCPQDALKLWFRVQGLGFRVSV